LLGKRKVRRIKYEPMLVAQRVLNNPLYLAITRMLLEKNTVLQAEEIPIPEEYRCEAERLLRDVFEKSDELE